jgi:hypothetical protein
MQIGKLASAIGPRSLHDWSSGRSSNKPSMDELVDAISGGSGGITCEVLVT